MASKVKGIYQADGTVRDANTGKQWECPKHGKVVEWSPCEAGESCSIAETVCSVNDCYKNLRPPRQAPVAVAVPAMVLPEGSEERKDIPITTGVLDYFPNALAVLARVAKKGNDKHNPGQPLHWSRAKSQDHADCIGRHLIDRGRIDPTSGESHTAMLAWRAMAMLQLEEEANGAPQARGAR